MRIVILFFLVSFCIKANAQDTLVRQNTPMWSDRIVLVDSIHFIHKVFMCAPTSIGYGIYKTKKNGSLVFEYQKLNPIKDTFFCKAKKTGGNKLHVILKSQMFLYDGKKNAFQLNSDSSHWKYTDLGILGYHNKEDGTNSISKYRITISGKVCDSLIITIPNKNRSTIETGNFKLRNTKKGYKRNTIYSFKREQVSLYKKRWRFRKDEAVYLSSR